MEVRSAAHFVVYFFSTHRFVYSEGKSLSDDDDKTYWGEISYIKDEKVENSKGKAESADETTKDEWPAFQTDNPKTSEENNIAKRLQVIGSVMYGWGLEPQPVARFIMKESINQEQVEDDNEEEEDTTEEDLERTFNKQDDLEDDIDWSNAFQ